ncbi:MAG: response regulator [Acidovorax sp.]|jgi:two-component system KDP operon response regulator KdpE|uniref:response regulator n=1 Tax=Acidovorax sp. TaxID=1872122 RepID=UPI002635BC10|nr:response regulator [Acidovorax sp.]MDH4426450.1 response regulator [Acidovorax sp.]MDH4464842.1 response regulator [Acidovorax sp.]
MSLRVLLVEDDRLLRSSLRDALSVEGYDIRTAASLADARAQSQNALPGDLIDLVLLDLGLPDGDGQALLTELRRSSQIPVIVISAREAEGQKIRMLDEGADDYLVKPFGIGELLARMRVALRRRGHASEPALLHYQHGPLAVDLRLRRVRLGSQDVHLTPTEYALLARLVRQAGQVVTHRQLLTDVWGPEHTEQTHYLRLYMGQLRAKLETDSADPQHLLTEPGVGYRLAEPDVIH